MTLFAARSLMLGALSLALTACAGSTNRPAFTPHQSSGQERAADQSVRVDPVWQFSVNEKGIGGFKPVEPFGLTTTRGGMVVVAAYSGVVHGLHSVSGEERWQLDLKEVPSTPPTSSGDRVYLGVSDGRLLALDARTGAVAWTTKLNHIVHGQPTVHNGVVYVQTSEEAVVAVDESTGEVRWTYRHPRVAELEIQGGGRPTVLGEDIYVGFSDGSFYRLNQSGKQVWVTDLSHGKRRMVDVDSTPVQYGKFIIAASHSGGLSAVHEDTGRVQWTIDRGGITNPMLANGRLIVTTSSGVVLWIHPETGEIQQELELARPGLTSPMRFTEHTFVVGDSDRGAIVLDIDTPKLHALFEATVGISGAMAHHRDMLFVVTNRGMVYGLKASLL